MFHTGLLKSFLIKIQTVKMSDIVILDIVRKC